MADAKFMLPAGSARIKRFPKEGRLLDCLKSRENQEICTVGIEIWDGERWGGHTFQAYIKMAGAAPNPHTNKYTKGEIWYRGNISLLPNPKTGFAGENRAFVCDVFGQKGTLGKRGLIFANTFEGNITEGEKKNHLQLDFNFE